MLGFPDAGKMLAGSKRSGGCGVDQGPSTHLQIHFIPPPTSAVPPFSLHLRLHLTLKAVIDYLINRDLEEGQGGATPTPPHPLLSGWSPLVTFG